MSEKIITAECNNCESSFEIAYEEEYVSDDIPSFCPFCGEIIEEVTEANLDDEDFDESTEWE